MRIAWIIAGFIVGLGGSFAQAEDLTRSAAVEVSRTHYAWLNEAQAHCDAGEWDAALERLQALLDAEPSFVPDGQFHFESAQSAARRMLESLPDHALARYEEKFGGLAREKLNAARRNQDLAAIRKVSEQYPMTKAGYEALRTSAATLFDQGEHLAAEAAYRSISEHPFTPGKLPAAEAARWMITLSKLSLTEEAGRIHGRYPNELKRLEANFGHPGIWQAGRGGSSASAFAIPSATTVWEQSTSPFQAAQESLESMRKELSARGYSPLANFTPMLLGDLVIARSLTAVTAFDRETGDVRWQVPTPSHAVDLAQNPQMSLNPKLREIITHQLAALAFADRSAATLTSDGTRVFVMLTGHAPDPLTSEPPGQLLALDAAMGQELWRIPRELPDPKRRMKERSGRMMKDIINPKTIDGGKPRNGIDNDILRRELDLFFFGPPTALGDSLYVIGEKNHELRLFVIAARTGAIEWSASLAMTERPLAKDDIRRRWACPVVYRGGLILCPTGAGVLAAVDPLSRRCLWAYRYSRDDVPQASPSAWPPGNEDSSFRRDRWWRGAREISLVVDQEAALLVSPESHQLHAVSLSTGKPFWKLPLNEGLFLSKGAKGQALIIGSKSISFVNIKKGQIEKTLAVPKPGGRGARVSDGARSNYLLPLAAGGVLKIDLTHQNAERTFPVSSPPWGNLVMDGETILMQTHDRVSRLTPLKGDPKPPEEAEGQLAWAKSQREGGRFREAVKVLKESSAAPSLKELRDTLLLELKAHPQRAMVIALELLPLLDSTEHRLRGFRALAETYQKAGDAQASLKYWLKFLDENPAGLIEDTEDPAQKIEVSRYVQGAIWDLLQSAESQEQAVLESLLKTSQEDTLSRRDPFAISRYARRFNQLKWARELLVDDRHRTGIGQSLWERQLDLWAISAEDDDPAIQASAQRRLAQEHLEALEFRQAAFFFKQLQDQFADVTFSDGQSVREFLSALPMDSPVRKHLEGKDDLWPRVPPKITQETRTAKLPAWIALPVKREPGSLCKRLDIWLEPDRRRLHFSGGDRSGVWELALPGKRRNVLHEDLLKAWSVGPVLILQYGTTLWGIAPFDDLGEPRPRVLWQVLMHELEGEGVEALGLLEYRKHRPPEGFGVPRGEFLDSFCQVIAQVGPVTPGVLAYQSGGRLVALEPATGRTLWSRSDLPEDAMITGDAQNVLVVEPGASKVTVLRAWDGRVLAAHPLPLAGRLLTWWGGRALFQDETKDGLVFSLWDAVTNRTIWERNAPPKSLGFDGDGMRWGFITPEGELTLLQSETGEPLSTTKLPMVQKPTNVHAVVDESRMFLAITHAKPDDMKWQHTPIVNDGLSHGQPAVSGTLHTLNRETGTALWHTPIWHTLLLNTACGQWAFPLEQPMTGPMLVLHQRESYVTQTFSFLRCLDKRTGKVIHSDDFPDAAEHPRWSMNPEKREFEIKAYKTTVRFRYEPEVE